MERHIFIGTVHPERTSVNSSPFGFQIGNSSVEHAGNVHISIQLSNIAITVDYDPSFCDILTLKNSLVLFLEKYISVYDFIHGQTHTVEIKQHIDNDGNVKLFSTSHPPLESRLEHTEELFVDIFNAISNGKYRHIQNSILDLSRAIQHCHDTSFYCYRSIESLMQYFRQYSKDDNEAWGKLWLANGLNCQYTSYIKKFSDPARHGDHQDLTGDDRDNMLNASFFIVEQTINYILEQENIPSRLKRKRSMDII
jgi:hypothetical protein